MLRFRQVLTGALIGALMLFGVEAFAQTSPNFTYNYVPTVAQWNALFAGKQDYLGAPPLLQTGGTMTGPLITAPSTAINAGLNVPSGIAPTTPNNGDIWTTSAGIFVRINGATVGPLSSGGSGSFAATTPLTVSFPASVTTYACATCGVTGSPLSQFASTTSAQLAGIISNETGAGLLVFGTGPTLVGVTITTSFTATGLVGLPSLASQAANTVVANATGAGASPIAIAMPSCVGAANALQWVSGTGFSCSAIVAAAGSIAVGTTSITGGTIGNILFHGASNLLQEYTISGSGTAVAMNTAPVITGGSHVALTALGIRSGGSGAFDLTIANTENLTTGRTLTVTVNDAARTINMGGNITTANTFTTAGNFSLILTTTAATNVTLPITGTLATLAGNEAFTNKTYNGNTLTPGTWALTGGGGKTLTFNNSITLAGTDATVMTFPTTTATIARTDAGQTFTGTNAFGVLTSAQHVVTSASANALAAGLAGSTNPAFNVDASTASSATGWNIKSAAAAGGVALSVLSSGTNENGNIDAKGSGTLTLNGTATGGISLTRAVTLGSTINRLTLTQPATGSTLTILDGKTLTVNNSLALTGTDATTMTFPTSSANVAALNLASQVITGGASVTPLALTTGSITVDCSTRPFQTITGSTSAWSITAPSADGSCIVKLTNAGASAVVPTFSGFTVGSNTGAVLTTTASSVFMIYITRVGGTSFFSIFANQ